MTKPRSLDPLLLLGSIIVLAAILTWILPAGRFERTHDAKTGRTLVVPGSYQHVTRHPVGPWGALLSIPQGLIEASEIVFYILLAGGALNVVEATGAMGNFLNHIAGRFFNRPLLVLALASFVFLVGGAANSMYEEIIAFVPLLCALVRRLGLPTEMALGISVGTASVAACFSPFNAFTMGISQPVAELPLFSGFEFRAVTFVFALVIWFGYLAWYARKFRVAVDPAAEPVLEIEGVDDINAHPALATHSHTRDAIVLGALNGGLACIVLGGIFIHWGLPEFSAVFLVMGLVAGLGGGLGWRGTSEQFAEGFRRIALAAMVVGFARAISVVLTDGLVLDTIANALFTPLRHLSVGASGMMMVVSESVLAFPMPSDSGRALMSLPVMIPLADLLGLSRQMAVNAFTYSTLASSLITPTAGALLAMLAIAGVPYGKWLRFVAVPFAMLFALAVIAMLIGVKLAV
jgi:uncharacterized ion transporter superfamily protein YfcC